MTGNSEREKANPTRRAALYVDELTSRQERQKELIGALNKADELGGYTELLIYGSPESDVNDRIRRVINRIEGKGVKVTFQNAGAEGT